VTIPNIISFIRLIIAPIVLWLLIQKNYSLALILFIIAGVSDLIDGYIARKWNQRSTLGAYLDPLADKLLVVLCVGYFVVIGDAPWWWLAIIFLRDTLLAVGVLLLKNLHAPVEIFPTQFGKWATAFNMVAIVVLFLNHLYTIAGIGVFGVIVIATILTSISFVQYFLKWFELFARRKRSE